MMSFIFYFALGFVAFELIMVLFIWLLTENKTQGTVGPSPAYQDTAELYAKIDRVKRQWVHTPPMSVICVIRSLNGYERTVCLPYPLPPVYVVPTRRQAVYTAACEDDSGKPIVDKSHRSYKLVGYQDGVVDTIVGLYEEVK